MNNENNGNNIVNNNGGNNGSSQYPYNQENLYQDPQENSYSAGTGSIPNVGNRTNSLGGNGLARGIHNNFAKNNSGLPFSGKKGNDSGTPSGNNKKNLMRGQNPKNPSNSKKNPFPRKENKSSSPDKTKSNIGKDQNKSDNKGSNTPGFKKPNNSIPNFLKKPSEKSEGNGGKEKVASKIGDIAKKSLKTAWTAMPVQAKIVVAAIPIAFVIITVIVVFLSTDTASTAATICSGNNGSGSYYTDGSSYTGGANAIEFLCSSQNPLGKSKYTITSRALVPPRSDHKGMDLAAPCGTPIFASQAGTVEHAGWWYSGGNTVIINHGNGVKTYYLHQTNGGIKVKKGDKVGKGQRIGTVGTTGQSTGCHLHYNVQVNGDFQRAVNSYFPQTFKKQTSGINPDFKNQCGAKFDGELAGDSANAENYSDFGNDDTSSESSGGGSTQCCDTSSSSTSTSSGDYCPNGITVKKAGTMSLDDYVAGVISAENSYKNSDNPDNIEAMKAQAIASRTYAVNATNNCKSAIGNSQSSQVYTSPNERAKRASSETAGAVMTYNGEPFSSQYDAFCMNDKDCSSAKCNGTTCTATYTKVPSKETHKLTLKSPHSATVSNGSLNGAGHANGMSQLMARQLQDEGKTYDEILRYFYAEGVDIPGSVNQCSLGKASLHGNIWYYNQKDFDEPYGTYGTIATHGCGPTAMAIAVSSLLNESHDPVELTNYACATQSPTLASNNHVTSAGNAIVSMARKLAWPLGTPQRQYKYKMAGSAPTPAFKKALNTVYPDRSHWSIGPRRGASCDVFVGTVVRSTGYDKVFGRGLSEQLPHIKSSTKWRKVPASDIKPGDILFTPGPTHVLIYLGNNQTAEAGLRSNYGRIVQKDIQKYIKRRKITNIFRATGTAAGTGYIPINKSKTNYCTAGGTLHSFFEAVGKDYGLTVKRVSKKNSNEVLTALKGGNSIVIAIMGPGHFTNEGHFITLTGYDGSKVFVHDPNDGENRKTNKLWDFELIKEETSTDVPFWIISR